MTIQTIILAAGVGKRMRSTLPKVLHPLGGKPLLDHVLEVAQVFHDDAPIVVYGHKGDQLKKRLAKKKITWVEQTEQRGTGHALLCALPSVHASHVLVLYGDVPLISAHSLKHLIETTPMDAIGILTAKLPEPYGYGRIKRDEANSITQIIEEKDATCAEKKINEINTGIYFIPTAYLKKWLPQIEPKNAQSEYYLTDMIKFAVQERIPIHDVAPLDYHEVLGINDRLQLMQLERFYQHKKAEALMMNGVTVLDATRLDIRGDVQIESDVMLDVNVVLIGKVMIGEGSIIGPGVVLRDVEIARGVEIKAHSMIEEAKVGMNCVIGPFARIRPGSRLENEVHVGNFVEIKNSIIHEASKVNHLSYLGDSEVGHHVNIGAGTITCNYDGANKHKTVIGDHVHIGSDTQLIAPVNIGEGATIAAGSTIVKDVPAKKLTLTHRIDQRTLDDWERPEKG